MRSLYILSFLLIMPSILLSQVPETILSPVLGSVKVSTCSTCESFSHLGCGNDYWNSNSWCAWQWGANDPVDTHSNGGGIDGANDQYSWDFNKLYELGEGVYSVEDGKLVFPAGYGGSKDCGLMIEHTNTDGSIWYSSYLHISN